MTHAACVAHPSLTFGVKAIESAHGVMQALPCRSGPLLVPSGGAPWRSGAHLQNPSRGASATGNPPPRRVLFVIVPASSSSHLGLRFPAARLAASRSPCRV